LTERSLFGLATGTPETPPVIAGMVAISEPSRLITVTNVGADDYGRRRDAVVLEQVQTDRFMSD